MHATCMSLALMGIDIDWCRCPRYGTCVCLGGTGWLVTRV